MNREEFKELKNRVLRNMGPIYKELSSLNLKKEGVSKSTLEDIVKMSGLTMKEIELIGYGYDAESMTFKRMRNVTFEDIQEQEQGEEIQAVSVVDNRTPLSTVMKTKELQKFQGIMNNYGVLMEMIEMYKQNKGLNLDDKAIIIELPIEEDKQFKKTFRINKSIFEQFELFCKDHQEYTVKDLVSMALKEYMDNHK